ncbi:hypothetical protein Vretifemale_15969, partial [Volvox reticuliferus]
EQPLSSEGMFLFLQPTFSRRGCDAASGTSHYSVRLKVQGCEAFRGRMTPANAEACVESAECTRTPSRCPRNCLHDLLEATEATFDVDMEGAVSSLALGVATDGAVAPDDDDDEVEKDMAVKGKNRDGKSEEKDVNGDENGAGGLLELAAACAADPWVSGRMQQQQQQQKQKQRSPGNGDGGREDAQRRVESLRRIFQLLSEQAHNRYNNVSEELPVATTVSYGPSNAAEAE